MFLFDWFRSFLPLHNPIGFGVADFLELGLALCGFLLIFFRAWFQQAFRRFAARTGWCMLLLAVLPVALRLALLWRFPVPTPAFSDDFGYLMLADTIRHFRFANPTHPLHQFFEAIFILQQPAYASSFPMGQGLVLALGWTLFGHPWAGVLLSVAALCALSYWMLRAWTTPAWALLGGLLSVCVFGPLCQWTNLYWGGAVSGVAGCLIFGSLPRLRERWTTREALLLGAGLGLQMLTRPYEFVFIAAAVVLYFRKLEWRSLTRMQLRAAGMAALAFLPAVLLMLVQNRQVTGSFTTLPYEESRYQYAIPAAFTFQPNLVPHRPLTDEEDLNYRAQALVHNEAVKLGFTGRFIDRIKFFRFFFLTPLYLVLPAFLLALREWRFRWVAAAILLLAAGTNFYPYFYPHYIAAVSCLLLLIAVTALHRLARFPAVTNTILAVCAFQFAGWYGVYLLGNDRMLLDLARYQTWNFINYGDSEGRIAINKRLAAAPGKQLVFVRYSWQHMFHEWIEDFADPDSARVVWAADLGKNENQKLLDYYPDRKPWLVEPDARPPLLMPYELALPKPDAR